MIKNKLYLKKILGIQVGIISPKNLTDTMKIFQNTRVTSTYLTMIIKNLKGLKYLLRNILNQNIYYKMDTKFFLMPFENKTFLIRNNNVNLSINDNFSCDSKI